MRYKGDGSYKPIDFKREVSFLSLLQHEHDVIDTYNNQIRSYDLASRNGMRTHQHVESIKETAKAIREARIAIKDYIENVLEIEEYILEDI